MPDSLKTESEESEQNWGTRIFTYIFGAITLCISSYFILLTIIPIVFYYSQPLKNAIARGDIVAMKRAIAKGADVNAIGRTSKRTMLTAACNYGRYDEKLWKTPKLRQQKIREMLELLIDSGADINTKDKFGYTALCLVTSNPYKRHPASVATVKEHKKLVAMLLTKGADVNTKYENGNTPLHNAVGASFHSDNLEVVELLIQSGADVNAKNNKGETPLKWAIEGKKKEIIQLLRQHGAKE